MSANVEKLKLPSPFLYKNVQKPGLYNHFVQVPKYFLHRVQGMQNNRIINRYKIMQPLQFALPVHPSIHICFSCLKKKFSEVLAWFENWRVNITLTLTLTKNISAERPWGINLLNVKTDIKSYWHTYRHKYKQTNGDTKKLICNGAFICPQPSPIVTPGHNIPCTPVQRNNNRVP